MIPSNAYRLNFSIIQSFHFENPKTTSSIYTKNGRLFEVFKFKNKLYFYDEDHDGSISNVPIRELTQDVFEHISNVMQIACIYSSQLTSEYNEYEVSLNRKEINMVRGRTKNISGSYFITFGKKEDIPLIG